MDHKISKLNNGLRLVTYPMPHLESVTVMVGVAAGSRYEDKKISGLSHFLEHMAFKGTKKRPTALAIATEIDGVGGECNAFTGKEFTGYYIKLASKHTRLACDILSDMLTDSLFDEKQIEKEKGVIVEEMHMRNDLPTVQAWDNFIQLLYGNNSMGRSTIGLKGTVTGIGRDDFLDYTKSLYYPENMVLAIAGKIGKKEVEDLTQNYFCLLQEGGKKVTKSIRLDQKKAKVKLVHKKTDQAHFCLGVPGYSLKDKKRYALAILVSILGEGMSSRLFQEIREKRGLAYYVSSDVDLYTDSGYLICRAGVKLEKLDEAIKVMLSQFQRLATKKVETKELVKVKEMLKGHLILSIEDSRNIAELFSMQLALENKIKTLKEIIEFVDGVTADDIQRVAKDLLRPEKLNLVVVGPYKENLENRFKKLLQ